jgi:metallo-beta-lactamase class B
MKLPAALLSCVVSYIALAASPLPIQQRDASAIAPFKIAGNIYYVGTTDPTAFLITTNAGHILIDTTYEQTAPIVADSIRTLGFKLEDVKVILSSHAHLDHVGGHALMKKLTGAQVVATAEDATNLESGGATAFHQVGGFPRVQVDRRLKDGETVRLGNATLTAHLVPGHTEGNTAWTTTVEADGKTYNVLFAASMSVNPGVKLVNNPKWPGVADAYVKSFARLKAIKYDIFLGPHAGFFDLQTKRGLLNKGGTNPFVDPQGHLRFLEDLEGRFQALRQKEKQGA